jgi:L-amino acid N-acyltransferase YncA
MVIREVEARDIPAVTAIYGHHVLGGFGSFEETPPSVKDIAGRIASVQALGLPYLVADNGGIVGFAYASSFRPRPGYRFTAEDSVYVSNEATGRGVGRALLQAVIDRCAHMGLRQLMAIIGDSDNTASIGLHQALGFTRIGVARNVGYKHGRWVDIVWMQRALRDGADSAPDGAGLRLTGG